MIIERDSEVCLQCGVRTRSCVLSRAKGSLTPAAQALYEWMQYDEDGNPLTSNLMDYAMPSAAELRGFEVSNTETPSPRNPLRPC